MAIENLTVCIVKEKQLNYLLLKAQMKGVNLQLIMNGTKKHQHYTFVLNTKMEIPSMCVRKWKNIYSSQRKGN